MECCILICYSKKRKQDIFAIPRILDNIFSNLDIDHDPFILYTLAEVNPLWRIKVTQYHQKENFYNMLEYYDVCLTYPSVHHKKRYYLYRARKEFKRIVKSFPKFLIHDPVLSKYYYNILDRFKIRIEFLRLTKIQL